MVVISEEEYLAHYGTPRHSGRYPWGSGGNDSGDPRNKSFLQTVADLRREGLSEAEIARGMEMSTTQLRAKKSIEKNKQKQEQISQAQRLKDKGMSNVAAAAQMGIPESTYRSLIAPGEKEKADQLTSISEMLKRQVAEKKFVDIGSGVESHLNISQEKLNVAVAILQQQGYEKHTLKVKQVATGLFTEVKVLAPPGTTQREIWENQDQIKQIPEFSDDGGSTWGKIHTPIAVNPARVSVVYKEDGGDKADGVIYVRPGVPDLTLGKSRYAQVRIQVGPNHYLKGMAMYKDDLPHGTDLLFHTNKSSTGNDLDAMKPISDDKDYPFGAIVKQVLENQGTPKEKNVSAMNLVHEEGNWSKWNRNLSSQFLSKQSPNLAQAQLNMTYERRKTEFDEINSLTNPTIKKKLLESFADETDSAAVHLKAAALPKSNWHAILPIASMPPSQIYAPNYRDGERVALIRYPHGGTFEIPELTVNNKNREAKKLLGDARDAVGIHHTVAERLSGADFDGDTVLVIPHTGKIKSTPALDGLKNFDPRREFKGYEGMPEMSQVRLQQEMGKISNLITDMTLKGAPHNQIVRAVKHSMVVIDAKKHNLDYKRSAQVNGIAALKAEYQGGSTRGASTLISRKKTEDRVPEFKPRPQSEGGPIDSKTGKKVFVETGAVRKTKDGSVIPKNVVIKKLAFTDDAHTLSSGTIMEKLYADHSNRLKSLANEARLAASKTPRLKYSATANKTYAKEVASLNSKLALVLRNRPLERQAQLIANANIKAIKAANPNLEPDQLKKVRFREQTNARIRTGASHQDVRIEPNEWAAIQAGAISDNKLGQILDKADLDTVRTLATPRQQILMTPAKTQRAKQMLAGDYTRAEVAEALGVSITTLDRATNE